jgi:hypothetical protein
MDCRTFRRHHVAYVDGQLSPALVQAMEGHAGACASCGRLDTVVRRGLLVARNLPVIQPSADFSRRLATRLAQERHALEPPHGHSWRSVTLTVAAGLVLVAGVVKLRDARTAEIRLAPVVAEAPAAPPAPASRTTRNALIDALAQDLPLLPSLHPGVAARGSLAVLDERDAALIH